MQDLSPPNRLLLGPGPCNVHYRVLRAMATPLMGHLDPKYIEIMDANMEMLRYVFQTKNLMTLPISGTGSAGMEAAFYNVLEPGDKAVICPTGFFGERMLEFASRAGAEVIEVKKDWGQANDPQQVIETLKQHPDAKICAMVMVETSTGVQNPVKEIGEYLAGTGTLFLADTVSALGGVAVDIDANHIDVSYSCSQKGLAAPSGLAPVTFSPKAMDVINNRKSKVQSWYLDITLLAKYWSGEKRMYHHTAPISMNYALYEALRVVKEEGLEARIARHQAAANYLYEQLEKRGFKFFAAEGYRAPTLTTVYPPEGMDVEGVRIKLLTEHNIEVGAGLGPAAGQIWRIGLMGVNADPKNVARLMAAVDLLS
jgi:alanine-glyoxylate transaminase/serine-glyoxylate transaminase/serine-pyruvate transaminase